MSPAVAFVLIALGVILIIIAVVLFIEGYKKQKTNRLLKKGDRTTPTYVAVQRDRCAELLSKPDKESLEYAKEHSLLFLYSKVSKQLFTTRKDYRLLQTIIYLQDGICSETQMESLLKYLRLFDMRPEIVQGQVTNRYVFKYLPFIPLWEIINYPYGTFNKLFDPQGKQAVEKLFSLIEEVSKKEELQFYFRDEEEDKEADIIYAEVEKELPEGEPLFENPFVGVALTNIYLYLYKRNLNQKLDKIYPERKKERY